MKKIFFGIALVISLLIGITFAEPININTATENEITANLKGIGEVKAKALIEYRAENGPFKTEADLLKVKGIGEKTLEAIRSDLLKDAKKKEQLAQ